MSDPIRFTIRAKNAETDAPTVEDLLAQIGDWNSSKPERPSYFTEPVLEKAERLFERVTNGLSLTKIEFGDDLPTIEITPAEAKLAAKNITAVRKPKEKPYRPLLYVKLRVSGETIKCIARGSAQRGVEHHEIADIWKNKRVRVFGTIYYKAIGQIMQVESDALQFLPSREELPRAGEIVDGNFTGGLRSEEYLERLRNGNLS